MLVTVEVVEWIDQMLAFLCKRLVQTQHYYFKDWLSPIFMLKYDWNNIKKRRKSSPTKPISAYYLYLQEVNSMCACPRVVDITKRKPGILTFIYFT